MVCLAVALLSSVPAVASAWSVTGGNGATLDITREASDTASASFLVYRIVAVPTSGQWANGSYCATTGTGAMFAGAASVTVLMPSEVQRISYNALARYAHLIYEPSSGSRWFFSAGMPTPVYLTGAADAVALTSIPVTGAVSVVNTDAVRSSVVSVALDGSGTLPVSVDSLGGVDSSGLGVGVAVCALTLGVVLYRGVFVSA